MKNKISAVVTLLSIALLIFVATQGIKIGNFQILSISGLMEKNNVLKGKIDDATKLTSIVYPENTQKLEESFEKYKIQRQKYEQLVSVTNDSNKDMYETKQYDISYLWRVLGRYAQKRGVTLGIDVKKEKNSQNSYSFNFTLTGEYTDVVQFVADIENDSDLYFRIYNFKMVGKKIKERRGDEVVEIMITSATFSVRNVNIDSSTVS